MELLIVRHAPAEEREAFAERTGLDDGMRPLTQQGRDKMRKNAGGIRVLVPRLDLIASSPLQRALETADLLRDYYPKAKFQESPLLEPGVAAETLCAWLQEQQRAKLKRVALVGHGPDLSCLTGWFLSGQAASFLNFKKGAACLLDFPDAVDAGKGELQWLLTPGQLRGLSARSA